MSINPTVTPPVSLFCLHLVNVILNVWLICCLIFYEHTKYVLNLFKYPNFPSQFRPNKLSCKCESARFRALTVKVQKDAYMKVVSVEAGKSQTTAAASLHIHCSL